MTKLFGHTMAEVNKRIRSLYYQLPLEAFVWIGAVIYLATINPYSAKHLNMCVFDMMGIDFCPGCGLGLSISFILHGDFGNSLATHPLGFFSLAILIYRIFSLLTGKKITLTKHREVYNG